MGLPILLQNGPQGVLAAAAETVPPARLAAFAENANGTLALTHWRAKTLKLRVYDGDLVRLPLAPNISVRALQAIIDPADDLSAPMKGPFTSLRDGDASIARAALGLVKSARLLPAALLRATSQPPGHFTTLSVTDLAESPATLSRVVSAQLPMRVARAGRLHIFRPGDDGDEHYAIQVGKPKAGIAPLVRLHSACFTGDVLGSLKCDCGPQLNGALAQMADEGGVLLYLNQEGRGIGLVNKMRAYALQDQGFDTVEANHRLGFEDDERDFRVGAAILDKLGIGAVRLLTNNPRKVEMLEKCGIHVAQRIPLWVGENPLNAAYLQTKSEKSGHLK